MTKFYFPVPIEYKESVENKKRSLKKWKETLKVRTRIEIKLKIELEIETAAGACRDNAANREK